jgi:hypothetical protein
MKKDKKKIREPFEPKDTPKPPHIIEPNSRSQRENPVDGESRSNKSPDDKNSEEPSKAHLLGDDTEINDETTI